MMHSIVFGDGTFYPAGSSDHKEGQFMPTLADTYKDWFLIPSSRPTVSMPGTDTKFASIPGRDGDLDLSQWIRSDRPAYRNRTGSFEFYVENGHEFWTTLFQRIHNGLHGRKFKMVLEEDDPAYYYEGRFAVSEDRSDSAWSSVKIDYSLQPWKRRIHKAADPMVWDIFNFEADHDYGSSLNAIVVDGTISMNLWGDGYPWIPEIEVTDGGPITVLFGGKTAVIATTGITGGSIGRATYGNNVIRFTGTGTVSLNWRGGSL